MSALDAVILNEVGKIKVAVASSSDLLTVPKSTEYPLAAGDLVNFNCDIGRVEPMGAGEIVPMLPSGVMGARVFRPYITSDGNIVTFGIDGSAQNTNHLRQMRWVVSSGSEPRILSTGINSITNGSATFTATSVRVYEVALDKYLVHGVVNTSFSYFVFCEYSPISKNLTWRPVFSSAVSNISINSMPIRVTDDVVYLVTNTALFTITDNVGAQATVSFVYLFPSALSSPPYPSGDMNFNGGVITRISDSVLLVIGSTSVNTTYSRHIEVDPVTGAFISASGISVSGGTSFSNENLLAYDATTSKFLGYTYASNISKLRLNIGSYNPVTKVFLLERSVALPPKNTIDIRTNDLVQYHNGYVYFRESRGVQSLGQNYARFKINLETGEVGDCESSMSVSTADTFNYNLFPMDGRLYLHYSAPSQGGSASLATKFTRLEKYVGVAASDSDDVADTALLLPITKVIRGEHFIPDGVISGGLIPVSQNALIETVDDFSLYQVNTLELITVDSHPSEFNSPSVNELSVYPNSESYTVIKISGYGKGKVVLQFQSPTTNNTVFSALSLRGSTTLGVGVANTNAQKRLWAVNHPHAMVTYLVISTTVNVNPVTISMLRGSTLKMEKLPVAIGVI